MMEPFVVKHYSADERPTLKGNGFDGLEIGEDREEAERFVAFVNAAVAAERERCAKVCEWVASDLENAEEDAQAMSIGAQSCADQIRAGA